MKQLDWESNASSPSYSGISIISETQVLCVFLNQATARFNRVIWVWKQRQREPWRTGPRRLLSALARSGRAARPRPESRRGQEGGRRARRRSGGGHTAHRRLQQVHAAVIQEVGCALGGGLHHLVLADHLDRLVVDAQPAVEADLEDVRAVVAARCAAAVMVDHCKRGRAP